MKKKFYFLIVLTLLFSACTKGELADIRDEKAVYEFVKTKADSYSGDGKELDNGKITIQYYDFDNDTREDVMYYDKSCDNFSEVIFVKASTKGYKLIKSEIPKREKSQSVYVFRQNGEIIVSEDNNYYRVYSFNRDRIRPTGEEFEVIGH